MGIAGLVATAFVVGLSGAMAPGSLLVVVVTETVKKGFWAGPAAVAGHAAIEAVMVLLLSLGLGELLVYEKSLGIVGLLGGIMLVYFGYLTVKSSKTAALNLNTSGATTDMDKSASTTGMLSTAAAGGAASISNPYWILWWATVGAAYVASGMKYGKIGPVTFYVGHIASDLVWYSLISFVITAGKRFFTQKVYRKILFSCGLVVIALGLYFLRLGLTMFLN